MKYKTYFMIGSVIVATAVAIIMFNRKPDDRSPADPRIPLSSTRASERQDESQTAHSRLNRNKAVEIDQTEQKKMTASLVKNASAGFALSKKFLIADLHLSAEETTQLVQIFSRREARLADLLNGDATDDKETLRKICELLRNKDLRNDLAGILSSEKLATFDANEATRQRETIEARAYRDMAEINEVVTLTDAQKQQTLAALINNAPLKVEQEADARAYLTLHYGPMLADVDTSQIRGLANMVNATLSDQIPTSNTNSAEYQQWTKDNKTQRINNELTAMRNILNETQLIRYREHLEAEPAW